MKILKFFTRRKAAQSEPAEVGFSKPGADAPREPQWADIDEPMRDDSTVRQPNFGSAPPGATFGAASSGAAQAAPDGAHAAAAKQAQPEGAQTHQAYQAGAENETAADNVADFSDGVGGNEPGWRGCFQAAVQRLTGNDEVIWHASPQREKTALAAIAIWMILIGGATAWGVTSKIVAFAQATLAWVLFPVVYSAVLAFEGMLYTSFTSATRSWNVYASRGVLSFVLVLTQVVPAATTLFADKLAVFALEQGQAMQQQMAQRNAELLRVQAIEGNLTAAQGQLTQAQANLAKPPPNAAVDAAVAAEAAAQTAVTKATDAVNRQTQVVNEWRAKLNLAKDTVQREALTKAMQPAQAKLGELRAALGKANAELAQAKTTRSEAELAHRRSLEQAYTNASTQLATAQGQQENAHRELAARNTVAKDAVDAAVKHVNFATQTVNLIKLCRHDPIVAIFTTVLFIIATLLDMVPTIVKRRFGSNAIHVRLAQHVVNHKLSVLTAEQAQLDAQQILSENQAQGVKRWVAEDQGVNHALTLDAQAQAQRTLSELALSLDAELALHQRLNELLDVMARNEARANAPETTPAMREAYAAQVAAIRDRINALVQPPQGVGAGAPAGAAPAAGAVA